MAPPEAKQSDSSSLPPVEVRRAAFAQLTIYEVAEYELETLAHGSPDSLYLNFAVFLLSTAVSFLVALLTPELSTRVFTVFVVIVTIGSLVGLFRLLIWLKKRSTTSDLVGTIRSRLPTEGVQELSIARTDVDWEQP
jgi:hypothetical protein